MARKLFALTRSEARPDFAGLRESTARGLRLRPGEPIYVSNCAAPERRVWLPAWYEENRLGPDGCLLSPDVLARLGVSANAHIFLESGRLSQPTFHFFCWSCVEKDRVASPEDLLLLLDVSGSMSGAPLRSAKRALAAFVEARNVRRGDVRSLDRTGLLVFGGEGANEVRLLSVPEADGDQALLQALDGAVAGGVTPMASALERGCDVLIQLGGMGDRPRQRRMVLVTDGFPYPADPAALEAAVVALTAQGVAVATVGVGEHFDRELLTSLAARTGAPFVDATQVRDLVELLEEMA